MSKFCLRDRYLIGRSRRFWVAPYLFIYSLPSEKALGRKGKPNVTKRKCILKIDIINSLVEAQSLSVAILFIGVREMVKGQTAEGSEKPPKARPLGCRTISCKLSLYVERYQVSNADFI